MPIKRPKGEKCAVGGFGKDRRTADFDDGRGVPSAGGQPACLAVQTPKGSKPWHGQLDSLQVACLGIVGGGPGAAALVSKICARYCSEATQWDYVCSNCAKIVLQLASDWATENRTLRKRQKAAHVATKYSTLHTPLYQW